MNAQQNDRTPGTVRRELIRAKARRRGLTLSRLAELVGVEQGNLSRTLARGESPAEQVLSRCEAVLREPDPEVVRYADWLLALTRRGRSVRYPQTFDAARGAVVVRERPDLGECETVADVLHVFANDLRADLAEAR